MKGRVLVGGLVGAALAVTPLVADGLPAASGAVTATTVQVTASGSGADAKFSPPAVEIQVGDTVEFARTSGFHNVHFDDGFTRPEMGPSATWTTYSRTFDTPGTYHY